MWALVSLFLGSWNKIYGLVAGIGIVVYSFLINRNAKLKCQNQSLSMDIEEIKSDTDKVITIQHKQAEIAADPVPDRVVLYRRMRKLAQPTNTKS